MEGAALQRLHGDRLHMRHGPIDVVLRAWGTPDAVRAAEAAAAARFPAILPELVQELPLLRRPVAESPAVQGPVARRMVAACAPFARRGVFVTAMAAVAGAVADELLEAMRAAAPIAKAYVNDGGDIACHVAPGESLAIGMAANPDAGPGLDGALHLTAGGGIATSGRHGRSFSLGIADAVTVLADSAAAADAAATLVANAVNLDSPAVRRRPARLLDPDSDLGDLPVTVGVGPLLPAEVEAALAAGAARAEAWRAAGLIRGAALRLAGRAHVAGPSPFLESAA
ncbi:MAG TPA: UPF0280 family protein [Acetobacteraceae bacterium]|nr:UPF0280 family protein [Acetobacteraceae bacterium]